jgi:hypothetical protein
MVYHALHDFENKVSCTLVLFMKPHDILYILYTCISIICHRHFFCIHQGRMQNFKLGAHLKKTASSGGRRENCWGISCEKSRFYAKKSYFSNFRGGDALPRLYLDHAYHTYIYICDFQSNNLNLKYTYVYILLVSPSPLKLVVRISLTRSTCIIDTLHVYDSLSVTCDRSVVFSGYPPPIKLTRHDITDILLKMALNTINQT